MFQFIFSFVKYIKEKDKINEGQMVKHIQKKESKANKLKRHAVKIYQQDAVKSKLGSSEIIIKT